jgi:hypothetical protein
MYPWIDYAAVASLPTGLMDLQVFGGVLLCSFVGLKYCSKLTPFFWLMGICTNAYACYICNEVQFQAKEDTMKGS